MDMPHDPVEQLPLQHSDPAAQSEPEALQAVHLLSMQEVPAQQMDSPAVQVVPSGRQPQVPETHSEPEQHW